MLYQVMLKLICLNLDPSGQTPALISNLNPGSYDSAIKDAGEEVTSEHQKEEIKKNLL